MTDDTAVYQGTDEGEIKHCTQCGQKFDIGGHQDLGDVLEHWAQEHTDSEVFWNVLSDYRTHTRCGCCGEMFSSEIGVVTGPESEKDALTVRLYCEGCVDDGLVNQLKSLMVVDVTGRYVLDNSVEITDVE